MLKERLSSRKFWVGAAAFILLILSAYGILPLPEKEIMGQSFEDILGALAMTWIIAQGAVDVMKVVKNGNKKGE